MGIKFYKSIPIYIVSKQRKFTYVDLPYDGAYDLVGDTKNY